MLRGTVFTLALVVALIGAQVTIAGAERDPDLLKTPHCVARAQSGNEPPLPVVAVCYATTTELVSHITGGVLTSWTGDIRDPAQIEYINAMSEEEFLIGLDFGKTDYGDPSFWWTVADSRGCHDGAWYQAPEYPYWWWNDAVASARSYLGCSRFFHYEHINYGGSSYDCSPCPTMGSFNYKSSSVRWFQ